MKKEDIKRILAWMIIAFVAILVLLPVMGCSPGGG